MSIAIVQNRDEKRKIVEKVDCAFTRGLVRREDYENIFDKIDRHAIFIGAYDNDEPVGYAAIYANDKENKTAFITMIGVLDKMQGKHIGSGLMNMCIEEAKARKMEYIRLEVLNDNIKAINFYYHCGFEYEKQCSEESNHLIKNI